MSILKSLAVVSVGAAICTAFLGTAFAQNPCEVVDAGGTVELPPAGCEYLGPDEVHMIIDGLPPGTTIELAPIHKDFICGQSDSTGCSPAGLCEEPGGSLGGNIDCFDSTLELQATGTGDLAGFSRLLSVPIECQVHTGPRTPGEPVQSFDTEMFYLQGGLSGDPDFDQLQILGGGGNGMPSPGHTTLSLLPGGNWNVDSFFDITYQIDFVGAPGSVLAGMSGSTTATIRMASGVPAQVVPSVTQWGLILLALAIAMVGVLAMRRSRAMRAA